MGTDNIDFEAEIIKLANQLRQGGWILKDDGCRENFETMANIIDELGKTQSIMKKIPFDLSLWLQDKSQKVVTRGGESVRIICTSCKADKPIVALVTTTYGNGDTSESIESYYGNGRYWSVKEEDLDLFLVTEEPELTEFEEAVGDLCWKVGMGKVVKEVPQIKCEADKLLSIARKQIEEEKDVSELFESTNSYNMGFRAGQEKALQELKEHIKEDKTQCYAYDAGYAAGFIVGKEQGWKEHKNFEKQIATEHKRTPSPALTKIVESITPEKLEQTKNEMEAEGLDEYIASYTFENWDNIVCDRKTEDIVSDIAKHFYNLGKSEALKNLPKWKKTNVTGTGVAELNNLPLSVYHGGYRIELNDLEKLPKEE